MTRKAKKEQAEATAEDKKVVVRVKFKDTDEVFQIDLLDLTSEEEVMLETHFDSPLTRIDQEGWLTTSASGRVYIAYLARRRRQANFTYQDALALDPRLDPKSEEEEGARPTDAPTGTGSRS